MIVDNRFRKGDRVKVVKTYAGTGEEYEGEEILLGAVGTIVAVDESYEYPYMIKFDDEKAEMFSRSCGTLLWQEGQLEFYFDEIKKVKLVSERDLLFLVDSLDKNIEVLNAYKSTTRNVLYSLKELQNNIKKAIKEME